VYYGGVSVSVLWLDVIKCISTEHNRNKKYDIVSFNQEHMRYNNENNLIHNNNMILLMSPHQDKRRQN